MRMVDAPSLVSTLYPRLFLPCPEEQDSERGDRAGVNDVTGE